MELHGVAGDGSTQGQGDLRLARIRAGFKKARQIITANDGKVPERTTPVPDPGPRGRELTLSASLENPIS